MHHLITAIFVLCHLLAISQTNYEEGTILLKTGESITGSIKLQNGKKCIIKSHKTELPANTLKSITFQNGRHFIVSEVYLEGEMKELILEYLVEGKASLYHFRDGSENHYFIQKDTGIIEPLLNTESEKSMNGKLYVIENEEYKNTLRTYFTEAPALWNEIVSLPFNNKSLIEITSKYHNTVCDYDCLVYRKNTKSTVKIGLVAGLNTSTIHFKVKSQAFRPLKNETFTLTPGFQAGVAVTHTNVFGFNDRITFSSHLLFLRNEYDATNLRIEQSSLFIPLYLNYHLSRSNVKPFVSLGLTNSIFLSNNLLEEEVNFAPDFEEVWGAYAFGLLGGAGLSIQAGNITYDITVHYEVGNGLHKAKDIANNVLSSWTDKIFVNLSAQFALSKPNQ